jgi:hypothetical protein
LIQDNVKESRRDAKLAKKECCHFDQREKSFLDLSHAPGMTGFGRSSLAPLCPFGMAQDMLCASHCISDSLA